jgi:serine/threonine protein kinase, bacterial
MPLTNGQTFAGYTIIRLLGSGGMGEVYLAQHPRLPRRDALKILPTDISSNDEFRRRFQREAALASRLWHPHIVGVHDRGEYEGQLWISMDFVDGLDASRLLAQRYPSGMPVYEAVRIVTAVASALDHAHKKGLLHRDVKPANVMLAHADDDGEQRVLLTDFGIARNVEDIGWLTATNMTIGTVAYSAPEQLMGEDIDGRADQYSLAATAFHLLTGSQLFPDSNPIVIATRHVNVPPPALADRRPELAELDPIMAIGLAKRPEDRFKRCSDFARALSEQINPTGAPTQADPTKPAPTSGAVPPVAEVPPKVHSSNDKAGKTRLVAATAAVVGILTAGLIVIWRPWERQPAPSPRESPGPSTSMVQVVPSVTTASLSPAHMPPPVAPLPATPPQTSPSPPAEFAPLVGTWQGHHRGLTVTADGTITMEIPDYPACPTCAAASMPPAAVHIGLTSYDANGDGKFFGYVKDSSDTRVVPTGLPVEVDVEPAGTWQQRNGGPGRDWRNGEQLPPAPGRVMTISINGMPVSDNGNSEPLGDKSPFCDEAALGTCG